MTKRPVFQKGDLSDDFYSVLRSRVSQYLIANQLSTKASIWMVLKSLFFLGVTMIHLFVILDGWVSGFWLLPVYASLGFFVTTCAFNSSHDAVHDAYVSSYLGNRILGYFMDFVGLSSCYWKKRHTVDHHTFTNIAGYDGDIDAGNYLKLSPVTPYRPIFKYQHIYGPFLYCLKFFEWAYLADTKKILAILRASKSIDKIEVFFVILFKAIHITVFVGLPLAFANASWWQVLLGYAFYMLVVGFTASIVFQLAHIVEHVEFPIPHEDGKMDMDFAHHQLATTSNFASGRWLTTFICGGTNYQVEHHLFPHLPHGLLPKIAPIVRATALEYKLPYNEQPSFFAAAKSHIKKLKVLGSG